MMRSERQDLHRQYEVALADLYSSEHCVLAGNGTVALAIAYRLMDKDRSKVLLPAIICPNLVYAASYAGKAAVFCDVRESDATLDPMLVQAALDADPEIGAVVVVHLYGHAADVEAIRVIAEPRGVLVIEDVAQAMGATDARGRLLGTAGDCTVVSFGHTKIIDIGGGGGIVTSDARLAAMARNEAATLGRRSARAGGLDDSYRRLFYAIWHSGKEDRRFYSLFDRFPDLFSETFLYGFEDRWGPGILDGLGRLDAIVAHRRQIADIYAEAMRRLGSQVRLFDTHPATVPWRFCCRVDADLRDPLLAHVRSAGFDASAWYPCVGAWHDQTPNAFPVGTQIENEIVNLWVDSSYTPDNARALALCVAEYFDLSS